MFADPLALRLEPATSRPRWQSVWPIARPLLTSSTRRRRRRFPQEAGHNLLPSSVTSRPLKGDTPTIELVLGYKKSNESPILKLLLSKLDELVARVSKKAH